MTKTQKIKNLIITLILVVLFSSIGVFSTQINAELYGFLINKGKVISSYNSLVVHFISVGQGDAIAINLPDGKVMLIDTGLTSSNVTYTNYIKDKVLNVANDNVIDYLILTHADTDHTGGAMRLIQEFDVENIVLPILNSEIEYYQNLLNCIEINKINCENIGNIEIFNKNYKFDFFVGENFSTTNEMSYVVKLMCFGKSFLFTGDISSDVEIQLVEKYGDVLDCDILKVAHHGSKYSSCDEFLTVVSPEISVISCGVNSYGHPTSEAITNILETGSKLYRTDKDGNIAICVGDNYNTNVLCGEYKTIQISFNVESLIVVIDLVLLYSSFVVFFKREKRRKLSKR